MPNRILKESICASDTVERLTAFEETFFYRLIVNCDDFGRMDARPSILKAKLYPLKDVRMDTVHKSLSALVCAGTVEVYEVDGRPYLQMLTWEKHQSIRAKKSRYPARPADAGGKPPPADASKCTQAHADAPASQSEPNPVRSRMGDDGCGERPQDAGGKPPPADASKCMQTHADAPVIQSESNPIRSRMRDDDCEAGPTDGEVAQGVQRNLDISEVEAAAKGIGLSVGTAQAEMINGYLADHPKGDVLTALRQTAKAQRPSWFYLEGVLRGYRDNGGPDTNVRSRDAPAGSVWDEPVQPKLKRV